MWSNKLAVKNSIGFHNVVEEALAEERANAMGKAGKKLEDALNDHRLLVEVGHATAEQVEGALDAVVEAAWALVVQRECCGFRVDNHGWLREHYDVPEEVFARL